MAYGMTRVPLGTPQWLYVVDVPGSPRAQNMGLWPDPPGCSRSARCAPVNAAPGWSRCSLSRGCVSASAWLSSSCCRVLILSPQSCREPFRSRMGELFSWTHVAAQRCVDGNDVTGSDTRDCVGGTVVQGAIVGGRGYRACHRKAPGHRIVATKAVMSGSWPSVTMVSARSAMASLVSTGMTSRSIR
jgi:hypothetical protein